MSSADWSSAFPDDKSNGSPQFCRVSWKGMKELQLVEKRTITNKNQKSPRDNRTKRTKAVTRVRAKAPAASSPEIPILAILARAPESGMPTKLVLHEVRTKWFNGLSEDDCSALYPASKRRIVDTVIKWSKKNLVAKGEIFQAAVECPVGVWKPTEKGLNRVKEEIENWRPRYQIHDAIIIEEEKK